MIINFLIIIIIQDKMKISIVVPFYNTKIQYFNRMICSLNRQKYKNFEVIVVDDGSNKKNAEALDNYNYNNLDVKIIHQKNKGLPGARNVGIKNSSGEYVVVVDSDDILPNAMLSEANDYIEKYNSPDVIFGRMVYYIEEQDQVVRMIQSNCNKIDLDSYLMSKRQNTNPPQYYSGNEVEKVKIKILHQDSESIILGSSSANIYKKSVLINSLFDEDVKICEDQIFNRKFLNHASSCLIVPDEWYGYIQYKSSMIHDQAKDIDLKKTFSYWDKIAQIDSNETQDIKHYSNIHNIGIICDEIKKMAVSGKKYKDCKDTIEKLYSHSIIKNVFADPKLENSSINKFKLFMFKNKYTKMLFYTYVLKG